MQCQDGCNLTYVNLKINRDHQCVICGTVYPELKEGMKVRCRPGFEERVYDKAFWLEKGKVYTINKDRQLAEIKKIPYRYRLEIVGKEKQDITISDLLD